MAEPYKTFFEVWYREYRELAERSAANHRRIRAHVDAAQGRECAADAGQQVSLEIVADLAKPTARAVLAEKFRPSTASDLGRFAELIAKRGAVDVKDVDRFSSELLRLGLAEEAVPLLELGFEPFEAQQAAQAEALRRAVNWFDERLRILTTGTLVDRVLEQVRSAVERAAQDDARVTQRTFNTKMAHFVERRAQTAARRLAKEAGRIQGQEDSAPSDDDPAGIAREPEVEPAGEGGDETSGAANFDALGDAAVVPEASRAEPGGSRPPRRAPQQPGAERRTEPRDPTPDIAIDLADRHDPLALLQLLNEQLGPGRRLRGAQGEVLSEPHGWVAVLCAAGFHHEQMAPAINDMLATRGNATPVTTFQVLCQIAHLGPAIVESFSEIYYELLVDRGDYADDADSYVPPSVERERHLRARRRERAAAWEAILRPGPASGAETAFVEGIAGDYDRWLIAGLFAGGRIWPTAHREAEHAIGGPRRGRAEANENNRTTRIHDLYSQNPWLSKIVLWKGTKWLRIGDQDLPVRIWAPTDPAALRVASAVLELLPEELRERNRVLGEIALEPEDARAALFAFRVRDILVVSVRPLGLWTRRSGRFDSVGPHPLPAISRRDSSWPPNGTEPASVWQANVGAAVDFHLSQIDEIVALHEAIPQPARNEKKLPIHLAKLVFHLEVEQPEG